MNDQQTIPAENIKQFLINTEVQYSKESCECKLQGKSFLDWQTYLSQKLAVLLICLDCDAKLLQYVKLGDS